MLWLSGSNLRKQDQLRTDPSVDSASVVFTPKIDRMDTQKDGLEKGDSFWKYGNISFWYVKFQGCHLPHVFGERIMKLTWFWKLVLLYCIMGSYIGNPMLQDKLFVAPLFFLAGGSGDRWHWGDTDTVVSNAVVCEGEKRNTLLKKLEPTYPPFKDTFDDDFPEVGYSSSLKGNVFNIHPRTTSIFGKFLLTSPSCPYLL